ncbi:MAG TPA: GTP-binding protein, partial [Pseudolabrys sp.]|nr:GTP-binding protein [Pseudolabrys sp.]
LDAAKGEATPAQLLNAGLYDPERRIPDVKRWLAAEAYADAQAHHHGHDHHHGHGHHDHDHLDRTRHDDHIGSFVIVTDQPVPAGTLEMFLDLLRASHGNSLLRVKGIVNVAEMPDTPVVEHGVQHLFHPTARLERWPDEDHRTRLVFITRDLPERPLRELFAAFTGALAPDRPDRTAWSDNPLVPFGGIDR